MMRRLDGGQRCCQCQRCGTNDSFGRVSSVRRQGRSPVLSLCARRLNTMSIGGRCVGGTTSQRF